MERLSNFKLYDKVVTITEINAGTKPYPLAKGINGTLLHLDRVQEGLEIWCMSVGWEIWPVCHTQIKLRKDL